MRDSDFRMRKRNAIARAHDVSEEMETTVEERSGLNRFKGI